MAKTIEQYERELQDAHAQIASLKKAVSVMSQRLVANERKAARVSETVRRQSDALARIERRLRGDR